MNGSGLLVASATALGTGALGCLVGNRLARVRTATTGRPSPEATVDLATVNRLLTDLNAAIRTLPTPLNQREALAQTSALLRDHFQPNVICLVEHDQVIDEWIPKLAEGCVLKPTAGRDELPAVMQPSLDTPTPRAVAALNGERSQAGIAPTSGSGIYTRLTIGERIVGVLGLEHRSPGRFDEADCATLDELAPDIALVIDNARRFGRLRSIGAEEERVRVARDLHDRLGQWLTYVSFELERMITTDAVTAAELTALYSDVQTALDELREMLLQLRSGVSEARALDSVGTDIVQRFVDRTDIDATFRAVSPERRLSVPVENELLRILQEALGNIDRHAKASRVEVVWDVTASGASLTIRDNGVGFDQARGVRDSAYGLVGMRERTDVIGGRLHVSSAPGAGTTITVLTGDATAAVPAGQREERPC